MRLTFVSVCFKTRILALLLIVVLYILVYESLMRHHSDI
jgi:hypothetical protein